MEAASHSHTTHHEMPTSGSALTGVALSATLHCLTGCAIGEIAGMAIGTALGFSNLGTVLLAIALAFLFGYGLTSLPLLRAGLALAVVVPIALASDTLSIATMELVDNLIILTVPGAMDAGLGSLLFWGSLSFALVIAGAFAVPVNRFLIARGRGHAKVHETGIHGGPPIRMVAVAAAVAFVFGSVVLVAEAFDSGTGGHGGDMGMASAGGAPDPVRGLAATEDGFTLELGRSRLTPGRRAMLSFRIETSDGTALRGFDVEHEKRMHLIVVRRDMTGFQHLHPSMASDGIWRVALELREPGDYRVFADFKAADENRTLAADLAVDGEAHISALPAPATTTRTSDGYVVDMAGGGAAGRESELGFTVSRGGSPVTVEPYLGAGGHLVALREGDLAYLHVHPTGGDHGSGGRGKPRAVAFATEFPSAGRYRLFLQFKHEGKVHTAAFTRAVGRRGTGPANQEQGGHHGE